MTKIESFLSDIIDFEKKIVDRAQRLEQARNLEFPNCYRDSICYEKDHVGVNFIEKTRHDCPDHFQTELSQEVLSMSDLDFNAYVSSETAKTMEADERRKEVIRIGNLETKMKQFEALKKELGK